MALIACRECRGQMATSAEACPHCGAPNKRAAAKKKDSKQALGCLLILLAIPISFVGARSRRPGRRATQYEVGVRRPRTRKVRKHRR
jgi:hypothetical protein